MTDKQIIKHNVNVSKCEFLGFPRSSKAYCVCDSSELSDICDENPNCHYKNWQRKEQECERLRFPMQDTNYAILTKEEFAQLDQLKAEVKSKTEYIQEQREIINQYSKEIEMYKKCQGKRASKREEELKAENDELKVQNIKYMNGNISYQLKNSLYKQTLTEIKEIANRIYSEVITENWQSFLAKQILQKISEVENG